MAAWADVSETHARLEALYTYASGRNAIAIIPSEARSGNRTNLAGIRTYLDRLSRQGDLGRGLEAGTVTLVRWTAIANQQGAGLNSILTSLSEDSLMGRFWSEVVVQSTEDGGEIIRNAATGFGVGAGAVLAVVALVWLARAFR
jgi:hypothetical protein